VRSSSARNPAAWLIDAATVWTHAVVTNDQLSDN